MSKRSKFDTAKRTDTAQGFLECSEILLTCFRAILPVFKKELLIMGSANLRKNTIQAL